MNRGCLTNPTHLPAPREIIWQTQRYDCKLERLEEIATIESAHQQAKVFSLEYDLEKEGKQIDSTTPKQRWPKAEAFWANYITKGTSLKPDRHKYPPKILAQYASAEAKSLKNKNIPDYSCRTDRYGIWHQFSYIESRLFYCRAYAKEAVLTATFLDLQRKLQTGTNLAICGFDAWPVRMSLFDHYCDPKKPFGHEAVLYCLLTISKPTEYPWELYAAAHPRTYEGFFAPKEGGITKPLALNVSSSSSSSSGR